MTESTALIARNTRMMMGAQIVTWASSFVLMSFLPRYLGAGEFGRLYFGISLNALAGLLMDLGLTMLVVKEVARDKTRLNGLLLNGGTLRVLAWLVSLLLSIVFVVVSGYPAKTIEIVLILGVANLFLGSYDLIHRLFVGLERLEYRSIGLISEKVFLSTVGVTMLVLGFGAITIAVVMLLSMALNFFLSLYFLRRLQPIALAELQPSRWAPLLRDGFPFMISSIFGFVYYRIDVMMLSAMTNDTIVGWYGAPRRFFDTLMFFPLILNTAVFPVLSRLYLVSQTSVNETSRKLLDITLIAAVPVAVGMVSFARPIISLLFGLQEYSNSVVLLQIFSASLPLVYVNFVLSTVLVSYNKQKQASFVSIVATVINVTVNYVAIDYFQHHHANGAIGAAIATGITEAGVMAFNIYLLPKGCFGFKSVSVALKTIAGGAVMGSTIWLAEWQFQSWVLGAVLGSALYVALLLALKVISKREMGFLVRVLPLPKRVVSLISNQSPGGS